ncbi:hypothetical protein [Azospirillum endophyticum]
MDFALRGLLLGQLGGCVVVPVQRTRQVAGCRGGGRHAGRQGAGCGLHRPHAGQIPLMAGGNPLHRLLLLLQDARAQLLLLGKAQCGALEFIERFAELLRRRGDLGRQPFGVAGNLCRHCGLAGAV